jgi:hypothetical protein
MSQGAALKGLTLFLDKIQNSELCSKYFMKGKEGLNRREFLYWELPIQIIECHAGISLARQTAWVWSRQHDAQRAEFGRVQVGV